MVTAPILEPTRLMNPIVACAAQLLRAHPHATVRLSELLPIVAERTDHSLDAHRLRLVLSDHPDHFRLVRPWDARWPEACSPADAELGAWVVSVHRHDDVGGLPACRLRESVRWVARAIDDRSVTDLARWQELATEEEALRPFFARRAA